MLDFGICRPASEFIGDAAQTGSLRTRAPEILLETNHHTAKSDVWALGATIFNVLFGRFPLLDAEEKPPHVVKQKKERAEFERGLRNRIRNDWENRLAPLHGLEHRGLREILLAMLDPDPARRPDAGEVLRRALRDLVALVGEQEGPRFAARSELEALRRHLAADPEQIALLPERRGKELDERLTVLERALRAQRHYGAAVRLASVAEIEQLDPLHQTDADQDARLARLARLARDFRTTDDQADLDLLQAVREQLRLAEPPEHTQQQTLLDALEAALEDAKQGSHEAALVEAGRELRRLLPQI